MVDRILPLKLETLDDGSNLDMYPRESNPNQDYAAVKGISFENLNTALIDLTADDQIRFQDTLETTPVTVRQLRTAANNIFTATAPFTSTNVQSAILEAPLKNVYLTVRASSETQTTSSNYVDLPSMSLTPPAGEDLVFAAVHFSSFQNNNIAYFTITIDNTAVSTTQYELQTNNTSRPQNSYVISVPVVVDGSQTVKIRWRRSSGTIRAFGRSLTLLRVN
jgi:hypothetical protein